MINNVDSTLDALKIQSISVIASNTSIKFPYIKNKLKTYLSSGGIGFNSMLRFLNFDTNVLSSSMVSSVYLLAYMDFYAIFTILYANYSVFENLKNVSNNKYNYVYNLYKELTSIVKNKEILQNYAYSKYDNFLFTKNIDNDLSGYVTRSGDVTKPLSFNPILTLPILDTKIIKPAYITFIDIDNSINSSDGNIVDNNFEFNLFRFQNNKIGVAAGNKAVPMSNAVSYAISPEVTGTIFGYFADYIYVTVTSIFYVEGGAIETIEIQCSTNGSDWSDKYTLLPNTKKEILVEDNIPIGLSIILQDNYGLSVGDKWNINIVNSFIESPAINIKFGFDVLEKISYIKYLDISNYPFETTDNKIDRDKFGDNVRSAPIHNSRIGNIVIAEGTVDEYSATLTQHDYDISSKDSLLNYKYNFNIANIEAYINRYAPHGAAVINKLEVENINTITIQTNEHIPDYGEHTEIEAHVPKSFIEYNVIAENSTGRVIIPALSKESFNISSSSVYAWDYIIPKTINENAGETTYFGTAYYPPRFPVLWGGPSPIKIYRLFDNVDSGGYSYVPSQGIFVVTDYIHTQSHAAWYPILINNIEDIISSSPNDKWIKASSTIYYMYYVDENLEIHIAIREYDIINNTFRPFSGTLQGQIEIRSMDQPNITPMVFDYAISAV